jgi:hypothetical protein
VGQYDQTAIDSENADVFLSNEIPNAAARCASPSPARRVVPSPPSQPGPAPAISSPATPGVGGEDAEVADEVGPRSRDERSEVAEEGHRGEDEVRVPRGRGPLHPVGEPSVRQRRESLERQQSAGAVVAQPLKVGDVVLVEPGVGVKREALGCCNSS